jgi:hypothetical protein
MKAELSMQDGAYPKKRKKSVAGQFAVKYRSETCGWTKNLNREDYGRQVLGTSCCCKKSKHCWKTINTVAFTWPISRLRFENSRLRLRFLAGWDLIRSWDCCKIRILFQKIKNSFYGACLFHAPLLVSRYPGHGLQSGWDGILLTLETVTWVHYAQGRQFGYFLPVSHRQRGSRLYISIYIYKYNIHIYILYICQYIYIYIIYR